MKKIFKKIVALFKKWFGHKTDQQDNPSSPSSQSGSSSGASSKFKVVNCYGGFKFENAVEDKAAQIQNLIVNQKGMKYGWKSGSTLKGWGLSDTDAHALAVFAVKGADGVYRGGKFDWISKSRTTRSFENIRAGYIGWPKNAIETAKGYAFCIVSQNGKKRTNWITSNSISKDATFACGKPLTDKYDNEDDQ